MKKLLIGLITLGSISAFGQSQIIETSYDCEVDVELKFVGRKVPEGIYGSCANFSYETKGAHKGKTFTFSKLKNGGSKLAAIASLVIECSDLTRQFDDSGFFNGCVGDKMPVKGSSSEVPFITREGLMLANNQAAAHLKVDPEARILDVNRFCKKLVSENVRCESVKTIIKD